MDFKEFGPLDEIADITGALTYGEMIDLAAELWKAAGGAEITAETFPAIFHRWSKGRADRPETPAPAGTALVRVDEKITQPTPAGILSDPFHKG